MIDEVIYDQRCGSKTLLGCGYRGLVNVQKYEVYTTILGAIIRTNASRKWHKFETERQKKSRQSNRQKQKVEVLPRT